MSNHLLGLEILSDALTLANIGDNFKKAFVLDETQQHVSMVINEEKIMNVKELIDDCSFVVTITGQEDTTPGYFLCERKGGSKYKKIILERLQSVDYNNDYFNLY